MNSIDRSVLDAWFTLPPEERVLRLSSLPPRPRPRRADCITLRAADSRFDVHAYLMPVRRCSLGTQSVKIDADTLRSLCAPIHIPWPGVRWTRAARLLGRHEESLRGWIRDGVLEVRYDKASCHNSNGKPIPVVWSSSPLDPSANHASAPGVHWGSVWQTLRDHIPADFEQWVRRIPVLCPYPGHDEPRARGWHWLCPSCKRTTTRLFLPVRPFTLADYLSRRRPSSRTAPRIPRRIRLACHRCHQIRYDSLVARAGWNSFIRSITRGLVSGHEVKRPPDLVVRRKKEVKRRPRVLGPLTPRERDILELLELVPGDPLPAGRAYSRRAPEFVKPRRKRRTIKRPLKHPRRQRVRPRVRPRWLLRASDIADLLGIVAGTVNANLRRLYRTHQVSNRAELLRVLHAKRLLPPKCRAQLRAAG